MGSLEQVLAEFGQDIGLTALAPSAQGHVQLRLDSGALLGASTQDEEVVLHYVEPVEHGAAPLVFAALCRAGRVETAADPVQVGLRSTGQGDWLVVGTRLPLERLSVREVHRLATYLQSWLAQVRQNR